MPLFPPFDRAEPFELSCSVLNLLGTRLKVSGQHHVPLGAPLIVVSNHRSPFDAAVLMAGLERNIAFVCHRYMANVPGLRDLVERFGAFPLDTPSRFFKQGYRRLKQRETIGIFPEGAKPMVELQTVDTVNSFHRGFAHLALRVSVGPLALLPVAIASDEVGFESLIPLRLLSFFDPSEPLFQQSGGHPIVIYPEVDVRIGKPIWVMPEDRETYKGRQGSSQAQELTEDCWTAVNNLLKQ